MVTSSPLVGSSAGAPSKPTTEPDYVAVDMHEGREPEKGLGGGGSREAGYGNGELQTSGRTATAENLAESQIRGLLWLEQPGNEVFLKAHRTWEAQDALFASRIDKKKKESNSLHNEVYQLFGFYSVFQGVLLTAVAQSNYLHCHNWWTAFSLSLLASLATIGGVIQKFIAILALEKTIRNEADSRQECISRVGKLLREKENFSFAKHAPDGKSRRFNQRKLRLSVSVVFFGLIAFSVLFLASILRILCHAGAAD